MSGRSVSTWYTGPVLFYATVPEILDAKNARFPSRFPDTFWCSFLQKIQNRTTTVTEIDRSLKRMLFYIFTLTQHFAACHSECDCKKDAHN